MSFAFRDIGSSDCNPSTSSALAHRLVSLTRDLSVFNDLSGDEICRMYWRMIIICTLLFLSRVYQTINLKKRAFVSTYRSVIDLRIRLVPSGNNEIIAQQALEHDQRYP